MFKSTFSNIGLNFIKSFRLLPFLFLMLYAFTVPIIQGQGVVNVFSPSFTSLSGHHNDPFPFLDPINVPISKMTLLLDIGGMNQINPNGEATVFRNDSLSPAMVRNDTHFLLDPSQFTILSQDENENTMSATIQFHEPRVFDGSAFTIAQVVARDGHSASDGSWGSLRGTVTTPSGDVLELQSLVIIPEPATISLWLIMTAVMIPVLRKRTHP